MKNMLSVLYPKRHQRVKGTYIRSMAIPFRNSDVLCYTLFNCCRAIIKIFITRKLHVTYSYNWRYVQ